MIRSSLKGTLYSIDNLSRMPVNLDGLDMKENDTHVLFSGELTPLSNFYKCQIKVNDVAHSSTEHLFQYERSLMLDRRDVALKVIAAPTPFEAMKAGREVNAPKDWVTSKGKQLMTDILKAKIEQVPEFKKMLIDKAGKIFTESTTNKVWGTGIRITAGNAEDHSKWKGTNFLGEIITELAKSIKKSSN